MSIFLLFACAEISGESTPFSASQEVAVEKSIINNYKLPRVEIFDVSYVYKELPKKVYAANDGINLRNRATANSGVLSKLPLGYPIEILKVEKEETLGTRTDNWYHVRVRKGGKNIEGYLYGSTLTPHVLKSDWDNDGKEERIFAVFNERKELLLRIAESDGSVKWSNLSSYTQEDFVAESLTIKLLPKEIAGMPMIKIEVENENANFFWTKFVSYHHGVLLRALEYTEKEEDNRYTKVTPQFGPKKLHVHTIDGTVLEDGTEKQSIVTSRYRYRSGVFYKKNESPPKEKIIPPSTYN